MHDWLVCELSGPRWMGRSRRYSSGLFADMWLTVVFSPSRWNDSFSLKLDVYSTLFASFLGATLALQLLLSCTGFDFFLELCL